MLTSDGKMMVQFVVMRRVDEFMVADGELTRSHG